MHPLMSMVLKRIQSTGFRCLSLLHSFLVLSSRRSEYHQRRVRSILSCVLSLKIPSYTYHTTQNSSRDSHLTCEDTGGQTPQVPGHSMIFITIHSLQHSSHQAPSTVPGAKSQTAATPPLSSCFSLFYQGTPEAFLPVKSCIYADFSCVGSLFLFCHDSCFLVVFSI